MSKAKNQKKEKNLNNLCNLWERKNKILSPKPQRPSVPCLPCVPWEIKISWEIKTSVRKSNSSILTKVKILHTKNLYFTIYPTKNHTTSQQITIQTTHKTQTHKQITFLAKSPLFLNTTNLQNHILKQYLCIRKNHPTNPAW